MISMSKYKGQHGGKRVKRFGQGPPPPFSGKRKKSIFFLGGVQWCSAVQLALDKTEPNKLCKYLILSFGTFLGECFGGKIWWKHFGGKVVENVWCDWEGISSHQSITNNDDRPNIEQSEICLWKMEGRCLKFSPDSPHCGFADTLRLDRAGFQNVKDKTNILKSKNGWA